MNKENKQLPTAEIILQLHLTENQLDETSVYVLRNAISAMGHYKDLHTAPMREELEKLRAENERLKSTPGNTQVILAEGYNRLDAENQKLREALEFLIENNMCSIKGDEIAKEALKGGQGE
ncbi:hypothetical protein FKG96_12315 [Olivibacter sp. LS-1]|uniref:hypothetical protein n=1 Tax=Olivibacter sp. LS-1 TaxID=2592345 RepID=UPI0011EB877F|nr:hypothetical protein [Olivibacter sp. LS-1]QEL01556.1 hypothetical protein FKG96_12315 [Olivibacter sp. LS-1]